MLESDPIISKVLRPVVRPDRGPMDDNKHFVPLPKVPITDAYDTVGLTLWQKVRLIPYMFTIIRGVVMRDYKTTVTGVVGMLAYGLNAMFGVVIPQDAIVIVVLFALSYFAGDSKKAE